MTEDAVGHMAETRTGEGRMSVVIGLGGGHNCNRHVDVSGHPVTGGPDKEGLDPFGSNGLAIRKFVVASTEAAALEQRWQCGPPGSSCPTFREREQPQCMIDPDLQATIDAMSVGQRLELVEYIESAVQRSQIAVTEEQKSLIRSRAGELQADPSIGLTREQLDTRMGRWK